MPGVARSIRIFINLFLISRAFSIYTIRNIVHSPPRNGVLRAGRRAGGRAAGGTAERAGAGGVAGHGGVAGRGRGAETALPRGHFPISRSPRSTGGELSAGAARRRGVPRGRARRSEQRAGSAGAVGLRGQDLRRDQRDVRQRIRRRDHRGASRGRLVGGRGRGTLRALR